MLRPNENREATQSVKNETSLKDTRPLSSTERAQFIQNMYSLILTARLQIKALEAEKTLLENK